MSSSDPKRLTYEKMQVADLTARRHGVKDPVQPLRSSTNHVFRAGEVVIRVAPPSSHVSSQVALARWLVSEGFPLAAPLRDAEVVGGARVSMWAYIRPDESRPIDFRQLGEVVARLHQLEPARLSDVVPLPFCGDAAWLTVEANLAQAQASGLVAADEAAALRRACDQLSGWYARARRAAHVVCHGDLHPLNVVMRGHDVVIIDWDSICLGPAAWDHAPLMTWAERWGGAAGAYRDFARGYGADLRESSLAKELAALRLLAPTFNMVLKGASDPACAAEARVRLRYWLGDPAPPTWKASYPAPAPRSLRVRLIAMRSANRQSPRHGCSDRESDARAALRQ